MDPALDPAAVAVFWLPHDDTSVVVLAPTPSGLISDTVPSALPSEIATALVEQGSDARISIGLGDRVQLQFEVGISTSAVAVIPLDLDGFGRLEAVHRLLSALHGRAIPSDTRLTRQQRLRSRRMLQAHDGARDGATQQDIAQVLFRTGPVSRDEWQASSTRHAVMALLRDARTMIAGGYRKLLRHRRRP